MSVAQKMTLGMLESVHGLSMKAAAKELGVSAKTIKRWRSKGLLKHHAKAKREVLQAAVEEQAVTEAKETAKEIPLLDEKLAGMFARLLHAGCPAIEALEFMYPFLPMDILKPLMKEWLGSSLVRAAVDALNGGAWIELPPERRYELALQKLLSEMAYYCHSTNFSQITSREEIEKFKQAREVLRAEIKGEAEAEDDPMKAFARLAVQLMQETEGRKGAARKKAPEFGPSMLDEMAVPKEPM